MWAMQLTAPERIERVEVPDLTADSLGPDEVLLRFVTGGLCGSDSPKFRGAFDPDEPFIGAPGVPLHELVGEVVASTSPRHAPGSHVVGLVQRFAGLAQFSRTAADTVVAVAPGLDPADAVVVQPVATVLNALRRLPEPVNDRAVVLGLGPLGLLFCHTLHQRGYRVTGVDRVDRSDVAAEFGIDDLVTADIDAWTDASGADAAVVVEAIGHDQRLVADAVRLAANEGHVVAFGLPDGDAIFPLREFYQRRLSLTSGNTRNWQRYLAEGQDYVLEHPELHAVGITHRFHPFDAQAAFATHLRPAAGRLKVVLSESVARRGQEA